MENERMADGERDCGWLMGIVVAEGQRIRTRSISLTEGSTSVNEQSFSMLCGWINLSKQLTCSTICKNVQQTFPFNNKILKLIKKIFSNNQNFTFSYIFLSYNTQTHTQSHKW